MFKNNVSKQKMINGVCFANFDSASVFDKMFRNNYGLYLRKQNNIDKLTFYSNPKKLLNVDFRLENNYSTNSKDFIKAFLFFDKEKCHFARNQVYIFFNEE